jgi:hypothetical protein
MSTAFLTAKHDPDNATYRHAIHYGFKQPLVGYSKKLYFNEKDDKRQLMFDVIGRLALPSFEKGAFMFELSMRKPTEDATKATLPVATIYPDGYELHGQFKKDNGLEKFLELLIGSKDVARAKAAVKGTSAMVFSGSTHEELYSQCAMLETYYPEDIVMRFYLALCNKNGWTPVGHEAEVETLREPQIIDVNKRGPGQLGDLMKSVLSRNI